MSNLTSIKSLPRTPSFADSSDNVQNVLCSANVTNNTDETFIHKLAESTRNLTTKVSVQGAKQDDEIGIFSAEKYFSGGMDQRSPTLEKVVAAKEYAQHKKDVAGPTKPKVHSSATPSTQSESSWSSSQRPLVKSLVRNPSGRSKKNKSTFGKSLLSRFRCKCYCSDKDSVEVDEQYSAGEVSFNVVQRKAVAKEHMKKISVDLEHRSNPFSESRRVQDRQNPDRMGNGLIKDGCFTFPTLDHETGNALVGKKLPEESEQNERKSGVFGSPVYERKKCLSHERMMKMLSSDANPKMEEIELSAPFGGGCNDYESDASSDLFELESLSGKMNPFLTRQESDATSGYHTPTTCYAPSEASIEWSVVTASAADFSIVADHDELRLPEISQSPVKTFHKTIYPKPTTAKEIPRRRPSNSILGCRSDKAVNVEADAYRTNEKGSLETRIARVSDSYMSITRLESDNKLSGIESRHRKLTTATKPLPRPYSQHNSQILYIQ